MAHVYTKKYINGVLQNTTTTDNTKLAQRDAANWGTSHPGKSATMSSADKLTSMAKSFGLTVDELRAELNQSKSA